MPPLLRRLLPALCLAVPLVAAPAASPDLPSREQLVARYGRPSQIVAPNLWIFWHPLRVSAQARDSGFDTLVARVENGKVLVVRWVNGDDLRSLLARHAPGALLQAPLILLEPEPPPPAG